MIRASIVGTTIAFVTPCSRTSSTHSPGEKASSTTTRRPAYRFVWAFDTAAMW
jgi:hypothetical protein